jgi:hypothetical protein
MLNKTYGASDVAFGDAFYNYNGIVEFYSSLPSTVADLTTLFTDSDYIAVATEDASFVVQDASGTGNAIFEFKDLRAGTQVQVTWKGQSNLSALAAHIQLQIWNIDSSTWEVLATDRLSPANANLTLSATISPLTNYKDANGFVACRVWQNAESISSSSSSSSCRSSSSSSSSCRSSSSSSCRSSSSSSSCRSSSSSSRSPSCWIASEIFGGWLMPKTNACRYYIHNIGPVWFMNFYDENSKQIAEFIHNKPILKLILRPLFEYFVMRARRDIQYRQISKEGKYAYY